MRLYVIGAKGQVARSLRQVAAAHPDVVMGFGSRPDVDLVKPDSVLAAVATFRPDVVINSAAYTAIDKAEQEAEYAFRVNRDGAKLVARAASDCGAPVIQVSTDYVFDGTKRGAYVETDPTRPLGTYGRSKLEGEIAVASANPRHVILRTSWVYAPFGNNFVRTILGAAGHGEPIAIVNDQTGCPTYALDIASAIIGIARKLMTWRPEYAGVTHAAGPEAVTWYEFACEIFKQAAKRGAPFCAVEPISTSEYPTSAPRPANSQLSTKRLQSVFDVSLPPLKDSLASCLDRLLEDRRWSKKESS
ncbi:dTDP-4-dehydrorhamnose reductase [Bradyrhizobium sp. ARR65]|uniref:dTDP-4-dehydrorhamnose reductase n=1 Tax=Bradyrhizobium sp. ARR65 TaxID=1040989 RepID=UPI0004641492|nr:dTDP-4-dehydrorhamnose reductase [Bradyrhizobium sp. ARR65]